MLKKLIKENLFHVHQTFHDTTEILNYLCDELIDNDYATKAYKKMFLKEKQSQQPHLCMVLLFHIL